ncbi:hypothetical protein A4G99_16910 [Haladaptatus sp. R4]|uniref:GNAT family N-acetyltransferase n=1 Tax=Haladaptatus sp. R4 TaxID=1679489 RepID=UPI0007B496B1|nr:GNAT family protein [Haladaptatus sp. R4]KZN22799.1 hypothetical protein A4G99_16910 [Haladaptatus sp. R4]
MPGPIFCSGERVELRTTEREDVDFIQRARTDPAIRTSLGFVRPYNHEQTEEFFENTISADNGDSNFLVCVDGEPVGEVNLFRVERDHGEIAYWLDSDWRGEGYATEAVSLLLRYAFGTRGLHRVFARIGGFNDGSRGLVERLGFQREGRLRDHTFWRGEYHDTFVYGLLREEWNGGFESHE